MSHSLPQRLKLKFLNIYLTWSLRNLGLCVKIQIILKYTAEWNVYKLGCVALLLTFSKVWFLKVLKQKVLKKAKTSFCWNDRIIIPRKEDLKNLEKNKKKTSKITLQVFYCSVRVKQLYHGTTSTTAVLLLCPHFNFCVH